MQDLKTSTVKLFIKDRNYVQKLMALNGFNNKRLSHDINVKPSYLSSIINGHKNSGRITAFKIAKKLGVEVSDIFFVSVVDKSFTKSVKNNIN